MLHRTQAYSWAPRVASGQRAAFEQRASALLGQPYQIRDLDAQGRWQAAAVRDHYYPVLYTQAVSRQTQPYGFDLGGQASRAATLARASSPGSMAVSAPLDMINVEPAYTRGLLIVAPVFADVAPADQLPQGYVMALLSVHQLIAESLPTVADDNLVVRILDLSTESGHEVLFDSGLPPARMGFASSHLLHLADHHYQLDIRPSLGFLAANRSSAVPVVALLGGLLSVLLALLLYSLFSQRQRALGLVARRTAELRISEQSLRETHNQLRSVLDAATQVAIIATSLRGVIGTFNAGAERMLGYSAGEALGQLRLEDLVLPDELHQRAHALSVRFGREVGAGQAMFAETVQEGAWNRRTGRWCARTAAICWPTCW